MGKGGKCSLHGSMPGLFQAIFQLHSGLKAIPPSPSAGFGGKGERVRGQGKLRGYVCRDAVRSLSVAKPLGSRLLPSKADLCLVCTEMIKLRSGRGFYSSVFNNGFAKKV